MSDKEAELYKLVTVTNERLTDLQKSYRTLNECHHNLEKEFIEMKAKLEMLGKILTYFITPSMVFLIFSEAYKLSGALR